MENKSGNKMQYNFQQIPIDSISVPENLVEEGDLSLIIDSTKRFGVINPIIVTAEHRLVIGYRQLKACDALGHETITANVLPIDDKQAEALAEEERRFRPKMSTDEIVELLEKREALIAQKEAMKSQGESTV